MIDLISLLRVRIHGHDHDPLWSAIGAVVIFGFVLLIEIIRRRRRKKRNEQNK